MSEKRVEKRWKVVNKRQIKIDISSVIRRRI